ncbi:MAG: hypothetical protein JW947_09090 [Sedimentisphaerales bacterium]|nr:hypothetical protein [Sedimentisphaerales bacterium]
MASKRKKKQNKRKPAAKKPSPKVNKPNPVNRKIRPRTKEELRKYLGEFFGLDIPGDVVCDRPIATLATNVEDEIIHVSPLDYVWYSFNADFVTPAPLNADAIIWANRGGGKTKLAAALSLLDCIFKPKCKIRILSGSGEQAGRMYDYFVEFLRNGYEHLTCGRITVKGCSFINESEVEVLKQSETSVRSHHVQKVRCDEVELFNEKVFAAAKFTTESKNGITGAFEVISTMNKSYGIMQKIIKLAKNTNTPIFKWCLWDVIEKCEGRDCRGCILAEDCKGIAKKANGYYRINDAITQKGRSDKRSWLFEMLCNPKNKGKSYSEVKVRRY